MGISAGFMVPHPPLIIPEVGRGEEKNIQKTIDAYQNAAESVGRLQPETIVLLSPHQTMYADYFHISPGQGAKGDFGKFRAGQVSMEVSYDTEFVRALCQAAEEAGIQAGTLGERDKKLDHGAFGELLDFSEDFCEMAAECGHRSFTILAGAFDRTGVEPELLSYEGPFGVGYGVCAYRPCGNDGTRNFLEQYEEKERIRLLAQREREDPYVRLARYTIAAFTGTGKFPEMPAGLPEELHQSRAGAFVSLKEDGRLRGCIGTIQAVRDSLAEEIMHNAVSACSEDPRFAPVEDWEVERLTISVDVLGETERVSSPEELDVARYGVIVTRGAKRGVLLPNLEGVDTIEQQISIAKQKAGIKDHEKVELERFEVIRHH